MKIVTDGLNNSGFSLAYVAEGDPFDKMSIVDGTKRTASAYAPSTTMFFTRETLAKELKMAELIK